jgi:tetratricopeptide (TPR) repeat protein
MEVWTYVNHTESDESKELLELLNGLPLAITQSAAFMRETGLTVARYLSLYRKEWNELANDTPLRSYPNGSIQTTWMVSYEAIKKRNEIAANLIRLWAYLDHKDLWYGLFSGVSKRSSLRETLPRWFQEMVSSELKFTKAIRELLAFSMIEAREDVSAYSVHPVVHEWAFQVLGRERRAESFWLAVMIVGKAIPRSTVKEYWTMRQRLSPHADCCYRWIESGEGGKIYQKSNESDVDETVTQYFGAVHMFGSLYRHQGKLDEAEEMYMRALKGYEKALGVEHTSTLNTVNNLGLLYVDQGKLEKAEEMYMRALKGTEKALGVEHTSTLNTVNNLGLLYVDQGKLKEAEEMYMRALKEKEKTLGVEHISTLNTVNNLGVLYADQGKLEEAEEMYMRALKGKEKALGVEHTSTLNTVNNLGILYRHQDKLKEAEEMYMRALKGTEKALGVEHTLTLDTVNNLGLLYVDQGKLEEAEKIYLRALKGYEKALSVEHTSTLTTVNNLGLLYVDQGKLEKAEEMFMRALKGKEKALGVEHTSTRNTVNNLGLLYKNQGKLVEADALLKRFTPNRTPYLDPERVDNGGPIYQHPEVSTSKTQKRGIRNRMKLLLKKEVG